MKLIYNWGEENEKVSPKKFSSIWTATTYLNRLGFIQVDHGEFYRDKDNKCATVLND